MIELPISKVWIDLWTNWYLPKLKEDGLDKFPDKWPISSKNFWELVYRVWLGKMKEIYK
jgi:hypothetical protein